LCQFDVQLIEMNRLERIQSGLDLGHLVLVGVTQSLHEAVNHPALPVKQNAFGVTFLAFLVLVLGMLVLPAHDAPLVGTVAYLGFLLLLLRLRAGLSLFVLAMALFMTGLSLFVLAIALAA